MCRVHTHSHPAARVESDLFRIHKHEQNYVSELWRDETTGTGHRRRESDLFRIHKYFSNIILCVPLFCPRDALLLVYKGTRLVHRLRLVGRTTCVSTTLETGTTAVLCMYGVAGTALAVESLRTLSAAFVSQGPKTVHQRHHCRRGSRA